MTEGRWQPVQARDVTNVTSLEGDRTDVSETELARVVLARWKWELDVSTGRLRNLSKDVVAGSIEEVAEAMNAGDYFTSDGHGSLNGIHWAGVNEEELVDLVRQGDRRP